MFDNYEDLKCPKCQLENKDLYHFLYEYECSAYNSLFTALRSRLIPMLMMPDGRHLQQNITKLKRKTGTNSNSVK